VKHLGLLRHAKSGWGEAKLADFDRLLNERGRAAARRLGEELQALGISFDLAVVSPARRAAETWSLLRERWALSPPFREERRLYGASSEQLAEIIAEIEWETERLLLVGHNPGLHHLALDLTTGDASALRQQVAAQLPTCALAEIELPIESWIEIAGARGSLSRFQRPRDLD
jgi:phosphohistidine phosphatase